MSQSSLLLAPYAFSLLNIHSFLNPILTMCSVPTFHLNSLVILTPSYFFLSFTISTFSPWILMTDMKFITFAVLNSMTFVFFMFIIMSCLAFPSRGIYSFFSLSHSRYAFRSSASASVRSSSYLADPGKARGCSTNTFVIHWFSEWAFSSHSFLATPRLKG